MQVYTPTDAAGIITAAASAGAGDVVILPNGTFSMAANSNELSPQPGSIWLGKGKDDTTITGMLDVDFNGNPRPLLMRGIGFASSAFSEQRTTSAPSYYEGASELRDGTAYLVDCKFDGSAAGNTLTLSAQSWWGNYKLVRCVVSNGADDCLSGQGCNVTAKQSRMAVYDCICHTPGSGNSSNALTTHRKMEVDVFGGKFYGAATGPCIAQASYDDPIRLYGAWVELSTGTDTHVCDVNVAEGCIFRADDYTDRVFIYNHASGNRMYNCGMAFIVTSANYDEGPCYLENNIIDGGGFIIYGNTESLPEYPKRTPTRKVIVRNNIAQDSGTSGAGYTMDSSFNGHLVLEGNLTRGHRYGYQLLTDDYNQTITFRNNVGHGGVGTPLIVQQASLGGAGVLTHSGSGWNNLTGSQSGYSSQTGDYVGSTQPTVEKINSVGPVGPIGYDRSGMEAAITAIEAMFDLESIRRINIGTIASTLGTPADTDLATDIANVAATQVSVSSEGTNVESEID